MPRPDETHYITSVGFFMPFRLQASADIVVITAVMGYADMAATSLLPMSL